jgi:uncharacterized protein with ParB-like and HNH nuclease domain
MADAISAHHVVLEKIFSNDYQFYIPKYQRPYSWTEEQVSDLFADILFASSVEIHNNEHSPYFLGSLVLIKNSSDSPISDVIDGQQRLTTISILISMMRHFVNDDQDKILTNCLVQPMNSFKNTHRTYRLYLREQDKIFFREKIQEEFPITDLKTYDLGGFSDSQKNIINNARYLYDQIESLSPKQRIDFISYLLYHCYLVVVSTTDMDSAYRIFSVMNTRGLDLTLTDVLKSLVLGKITDDSEQDKYTKIWEGEEEDLGRQRFQELFSHIRMILTKVRGKSTALKEFTDELLPAIEPKVFIDNYLKKYSDAFEVITKKNYVSEKFMIEINSLLNWLSRIEFSDWVPPTILFFSKNLNFADRVHNYLVHMERLTFGLLALRLDVNKRIARYAAILHMIENEDDLYAPNSPIFLTEDEKQSVRAVINGDIYNNLRVRSYLLHRLDSLLTDGIVFHEHKVITVEHILPQNPNAASNWVKEFPSEEIRNQWVHRLSNLVLLPKKKNSQASNLDFPEKLRTYFLKDEKTVIFGLTAQLSGYSNWTLEILAERQIKLSKKLFELWDLN